MAKENHWTIYGLSDPRSNEIRYVGVTSGSPKERYRKHVSIKCLEREGHTRKARWILGLISKGLRPLLVQLETVKSDWQLAESEWISKIPNLTNLTAGGDGTIGYKHSSAAIKKMSLAKTGISLSVEHRASLVKSHKNGRVYPKRPNAKGFPHSEQTKKLMSDIATGRKWSNESRAKMSTYRTGKSWSEETKKKMSESAKRRWSMARHDNQQEA